MHPSEKTINLYEKEDPRPLKTKRAQEGERVRDGGFWSSFAGKLKLIPWEGGREREREK